MSQTYHEPVLLKETLEALQVAPGKKYIDATLGDGGHTIEILKLGGEVLGIDYEEGSLKRATERIKKEGLEKNFTPVKGNFRDIEDLAKENDFDQVDGILMDLGYSTSQVEDEEIGMSFKNDQPLDMRLDKSLGVTAKDLIYALSEKELVRVFREFGEEWSARRYAKKIVENRGLKKIETTKDLADLIAAASPSGHDRLHPATKIFQALRITVNSEFENLKSALPQAVRLLLPGGRMAIISFHSLEDRIVKQFGTGVQLDYAAQEGSIEENRFEVVNSKPIVPSLEEQGQNPKSRSAKLRVFRVQ